MKLILNPFLVIYFDPQFKSLTMVSLLNKRHFTLSDVSWMSLMPFIKSGKSKREIIKYLTKNGSDIQGASELVEELFDKKILIKNDSEIKDVVRQKNLFSKYNWDSAFIYHSYSRDYPFLDYSNPEHGAKDISLMKDYAKKWPPPNIYKEYKHSMRYRLADISSISEKFFPKRKEAQGITKEKLSYLLHYSFGQVGTAKFKVLGDAVLKTSPSGGARHPTEAYVINLNMPGFPIGAFHYSVKENLLEQISKVNIDRCYKNIFKQLNQAPRFKPKIILVLTSYAERSMWRYRESRSFRVLFFDMGHVIATVKVIARSLGLGISVGDGFSEKEVKEILGLHGIDEQPFTFIALS